jgi:predicted GNAT family N-acyltransferase
MERIKKSQEQFPSSIAALAKVCAVEKDTFGQQAYILKFTQDESTTTVRIALHDMQSDADLIITHMTTLPESERHKGYGARAIEVVLDWAKNSNLYNILAVQVTPGSEGFWASLGFEETGDETGDFRYVR